MSYQDSISWYGFLLKPFSKCQDISWENSLKRNTRALDIRLCMRNGKWHFVHGLYLMQEVEPEFWDYFRYKICTTGINLICLRIILEDLKEDIPSDQLDYIYSNLEFLVNWGDLRDIKIIPYAGYLKDHLDYKVWDLSKFSERITINEFQYVSSIKGCGILPRLWTRFNRKSLREIYKNVISNPELEIRDTINIYYFDFLYSII